MHVVSTHYYLITVSNHYYLITMSHTTGVSEDKSANQSQSYEYRQVDHASMCDALNSDCGSKSGLLSPSMSVHRERRRCVCVCVCVFVCVCVREKRESVCVYTRARAHTRSHREREKEREGGRELRGRNGNE